MTSWNGNFSALLTLCEGNPLVTGGFPSQRPITRSHGVFFGVFLNKLLTKQTKGMWIKMSLCSFDVAVMTHLTSNGPPRSLLSYGCMIAYMFGVVNFDALTQASEFRIERRQIVFLCWMKNLKLGSHQISSLDFTADWLLHLALGIYIHTHNIIYIYIYTTQIYCLLSSFFHALILNKLCRKRTPMTRNQNKRIYLDIFMKWINPSDVQIRPISLIPPCSCPISQNTPFRNT